MKRDENKLVISNAVRSRSPSLQPLSPWRQQQVAMLIIPRFWELPLWCSWPKLFSWVPNKWHHPCLSQLSLAVSPVSNELDLSCWRPGKFPHRWGGSGTGQPLHCQDISPAVPQGTCDIGQTAMTAHSSIPLLFPLP